MPPVSDISSVGGVGGGFPAHKARCRVAGEGGPLGVGRCSYSLYKDFLSNPTVQTINFKSFVDGSVSSLLEHCLGWASEEEEEEEEESELDCSPLLQYLQYSPRPCPRQVERLCRDMPEGLTSTGRGPLHVLLSSPHLQPDCDSLQEVVSVLLDSGLSSPLPLVGLAKLCEARAWAQAASLAQLLLARTHCDVNSVNLQGRSLLSMSVTYLDESIELTRILINHGAKVWPDPALTNPTSVSEIIQDKEQSAFTWFLRAVINQRGLDNASQTLDCLCHEMGRDPDRMKSHVQRVMLSEGRFPRVLGPVFLQLKVAMTPFWSQPQHLRYLAWQGVRRSMGPKRLGRGGAGQLGLPTPLFQYITLTKPNNSRHRSKIKDF